MPIIRNALLMLVLGCIGVGAYYWYRPAIRSFQTKINDHFLSLTCQAGLTLENIFIRGREKVTTDEILQSLTIPLHGPMWDLDMGEVRRRIQKLRWVRMVTLERHWPDTLFIHLEERKPFALWQHQKILHLVDLEGAVIPTADFSPFMHLPLITGEKAAPHLPQLLEALSHFPDLKKRVISAAWVGNRRWDAYLDNKVVLMLPEENAEDALERFMKYEKTHRLTQTARKRIDLRIPKRIIIA